MAKHPGASYETAYYQTKLNYNDNWGSNDVKGICADIKDRAEDLKDTADKIRAIMEDLDAGNTLIVNGNHYGQYIEEVALKLEKLYSGLVSAASAADSSGKSFRASQDSKASTYQQYLNDKAREEREAAKNNTN